MKAKKQLTLPKLLEKAQRTFNAWVRSRDAGKKCVSCSSFKIEQASHFYSAGQHSALRFNEDNCHGACIQCNYFKHGNLGPYRMELENRIGKDRLALLDSVGTRKKAHKWSRFELEQIIETYKLKSNEVS